MTIDYDNDGGLEIWFYIVFFTLVSKFNMFVIILVYIIQWFGLLASGFGVWVLIVQVFVDLFNGRNGKYREFKFAKHDDEMSQWHDEIPLQPPTRTIVHITRAGDNVEPFIVNFLQYSHAL